MSRCDFCKGERRIEGGRFLVGYDEFDGSMWVEWNSIQLGINDIINIYITHCPYCGEKLLEEEIK